MSTVVKNVASNVKTQASNIVNAVGQSQAPSFAKNFAGGVAVGTALGVLTGDTVTGSLGRSILDTAAFAVAPVPMTALYTTQIGIALAKGAMAVNTGLTNKHYKNTLTGPMFNYVDSQPAYTMRQAAVQAIQGSKMNARNALGGEAVLMHRPYTIY